MSELEEHYLLRVPEAIADQLRAMIRDRKMPQHGVSFHLQSKFDIQVFSLVSTQLTKTKKKKKKKKKKKSL
jgi:N-dimethylarginine dimethylaminohydrolase